VPNDQLFQSAYLNFQRGQTDVAAAECNALLAAHPRHLNGLQLLAHLRFAAGAFADAANLLQRAAMIQPENPIILSNLGAACCAAGRFAEAIEPLRVATQLNPTQFDAWKNLGRSLRQTNRANEADVAYRNAISLNPQDADALDELAGVYRDLNKLDDAIAMLRRAVEARPQFPEALNNLAAALQEAGRLEESIQFYRMALAARPDPRIHGNLIMALHLVDDDQMLVAQEIARWKTLHAEPLKRQSEFANDRSPDRRLRVGYVSRDFNISPVGRFIAPILAHHDHQLFEVFAYADTQADDRLVRRNKSAVDHWRPTLPMSDDNLAKQIRDDRIDVLIDLGMHTKLSRVLVFARRAAPVQVSYLAYAGTTGLDEIDADISDVFLNPGGIANVQSFWCYEAPVEASDVEERSGPITFGCLNNFSKVTAETRSAWFEILNRVPEARLIVHAPTGSHREDFGIHASRIQFVDRLSPTEYFALYKSIDIALDTFPYPGGTTTCDALWMGTPVVTTTGSTPVSRAGLSILSNIGLSELVGKDRKAYIELAVNLARDRNKRALLQQSLRDRMRASPLMDALRAARDIEAVYRRFWRKWIEGSRR